MEFSYSWVYFYFTFHSSVSSSKKKKIKEICKRIYLYITLYLNFYNHPVSITDVCKACVNVHMYRDVDSHIQYICTHSFEMKTDLLTFADCRQSSLKWWNVWNDDFFLSILFCCSQWNSFFLTTDGREWL